MAYLYKSNQAITTFTDTLFDLIEDMITQGWRIFGSGDGLSAFENTGQTAGSGGTGSGGGFHVLTGSGTGANGMGNTSLTVGAAWVRLRAPTDALNPNLEYLWALDYQNVSDIQDHWRLSVSIDGTGFNTGGDADTFPTAADQACLAGHQVLQSSGGDFPIWVPSGTNPNMHWAIGDKDEEYGFIAYNFRVTDHGAWGVWGMQPLQSLNDGTNPPTTLDPDPFIHLASHGGAAGAAATFNFFDANDRSGMFHCNSSPSAKLGDNTGTQQVARGAFAFYGAGESPAHADTGCYSVAIASPFTGSNVQWDHFFDEAAGLDTDSITGRHHHLGTLMWGRSQAAVGTHFWKGFSLADIVNLTRHDAAALPARDENAAATVARLARTGVSVPWPQGTVFSVS